MNLIPCTRNQIKVIFKEYYAKYLSQHNSNRHYIIKYNDNNTFTNSTFENNIKLGESNGTYNLINEKTHCLINIRYTNIFNSPNKNSPFNKQNSFYPKLSNYVIGPFYTIIPKDDVTWLPVLYNHLQLEKGFKVLNFYKKNI
jgi:hypothetical protein|tara:strand:- start:545 stop:970 length:426 start_codon:yes stop_codon:yes gene_type:complete